MVRQKQVAQAVAEVNTFEITAARVKKDLVWVLFSVLVAVASGLIIGSFFKF